MPFRHAAALAASAFAIALVPIAAQAHITLEYQVAPAASSYKATFKVGHGCGASPTRQVVVQVPASVKSARPMPKPGWTIELQKEQDRVVRIAWTARTKDDMLSSSHYDEFVLVAQLPPQEGTIYWPVSQVCEEGRADWTEIPKPGQALHDLKSPAAALEILPAAGAGGHKH